MATQSFHNTVFGGNTMKLTRATTLRAFGLSLLMSCLACGSFAQRVPASSSDSGRRAVVAIDQNSINNSINNAYNTASYAVAVGNNAQNSANNAQGTANWAAGMAQDAQARAGQAGYGSVITSWNYQGGNSNWNAFGLCLQGWNPDGAAQYTGNRPCPAGSGPYVISAGQNGGGQGE
jgi:hypothetical protein